MINFDDEKIMISKSLETKEAKELIQEYYGHDRKIITRKELKALNNGKVLLFTNGEYTTSIEVLK